MLLLFKPDQRHSQELVHLLEGCPAAYPRFATTLLLKLLLSEPVLEPVLAELTVESGCSFAGTAGGELQGAKEVLQKTNLNPAGQAWPLHLLQNLLQQRLLS